MKRYERSIFRELKVFHWIHLDQDIVNAVMHRKRRENFFLSGITISLRLNQRSWQIAESVVLNSSNDREV